MHAQITPPEVPNAAGRIAELEAANDDLRNANRELAALAMRISEDLRTPLNTIAGASERFFGAERPTARAWRSEHAWNVRRSLDRAFRLADELSRFPIMADAPPQKEAVDVAQLMQELLGELRAGEGPAHEVRLGQLPVATADRELLRRALENLLANSLRSARHTRPMIVEVLGWQDSAECIYTFRNNRTDPVNVSPIDGAEALAVDGSPGLALAITKRIIERHGGRIWTQTESDTASVTFTLPS